MSVMKNRFIFAVTLLSSLALTVPTGAQPEQAAPEEVSDEALRAMIVRYGEQDRYNRDARQAIVVHGERATDAVFDVLMIVRHYTGGAIRVDTTPTVRAGSVREPEYILRLLGHIEAPTPVDRLCDFIERGLRNSGGRGEECLGAALWLLAASGHPKGLAYIQYIRDCSAKSFDPDDRFWTARLDDCIQAWEINHLFVRTGQVPEGQKVPQAYVMSYVGRQIPYAPSPATRAMRRAYEENPQVLDWDGKLDEAYLAERLPAVLPAIADETRFILIDSNFLGRFYEPVLAPLLLEWHEGRKQPLESLLGAPLIQAERVTKRMEQEALVPLIREMTGDIALRIKKDLVLNGTTLRGDYSVLLIRHDPEQWIGDLVKKGLEGSGTPTARAKVILSGLGELNRPLTDAERQCLPKLLTLPRLDVHHSLEWVRGDKNLGLRPLARKEPQAFREALKAPHLGSGVIDAVVVEKLYDDKQVIFDRIEYAMLHHYDRQIDALKPEDLEARLAKMPPAVRARAQARLKNRPTTPAPSPTRINESWLDLVVKDFHDDPDGIAFLRNLAAKEDFASQKQNIERKIEDLLKVHPEWK